MAKDRVGEIVEVRLLDVIRIVSDDTKQKKEHMMRESGQVMLFDVLCM